MGCQERRPGAWSRCLQDETELLLRAVEDVAALATVEVGPAVAVSGGVSCPCSKWREEYTGGCSQ